MGVTFKAKLVKVGQCVNCRDEFIRSETVDAASCTDPKQPSANTPSSISAQTWSAQNRNAILAYNKMVVERGVFSDGVRSF